MTIEKIDHTKYAVENVNTVTGERVRLIEPRQDWTAKVLSDSANEIFKATNRPYRSEWFKITDKDGRPVKHDGHVE